MAGITKYTDLYAVEVTYTKDGGWAENSKNKYKIKSVNVVLSLDCDPQCEIYVIDDAEAEKGVILKSATSSRIKSLTAAFRYGKRFNIYQQYIPEGTGKKQDMLLFSGFVFSSATGINTTAASFSFGFKVNLASAAKLYDNHYIKNPAYYGLAGSANGPTRFADKIATQAAAKGGSPSVNAILQSAAENKDFTDIVRLNQQLIDSFTEIGVSSLQQPLKLADMFNIDKAPVLNAKINLYATTPSNNPSNSNSHTILRNLLLQPIMNSLPDNSAVSVFCSVIGDFYLTVAPRVSKQLKENLTIVPACGFGIATETLTASDIVGFSQYEAQRAPNSLVNICVYDNDLVSSSSGIREGTKALVSVQGGYNKEGELSIKVETNPLSKDETKATDSFKNMLTGPIQTVRLPLWSATAGDKDKVKLAKALATTLFASSGFVAGNMEVSLSYSALPKVINSVGKIFNISTLLAGGHTGSEGDKMFEVFANICQLSNYTYYGRLKQLNYQFRVESTSITSSVKCIFDCVLTIDEYERLVAEEDSTLGPKHMLIGNRP